jgi:hypothetical protein
MQFTKEDLECDIDLRPYTCRYAIDIDAESSSSNEPASDRIGPIVGRRTRSYSSDSSRILPLQAAHDRARGVEALEDS